MSCHVRSIQGAPLSIARLLGILDLHVTVVGGAVVVVRRPQGEVVTQQLHDKRRVLVGLLRERVELGDGVVERLLREVARLLRAVHDLVVEHGEVERQAEADGVGRRQELGGAFVGVLVGLLRVRVRVGSE